MLTKFHWIMAAYKVQIGWGSLQDVAIGNEFWLQAGSVVSHFNGQVRSWYLDKERA
jgi:hypothetical protein